MDSILGENPPQYASKRRMAFPDGLRAIAALLVVLPHSTGFFMYLNEPNRLTQLVVRMMVLGTLGVPIFFVLSGFVIAYTLREQWITARYFGTFALRRSVRLDPPYWAAIVLYVGYIVLQGTVTHQPIAWPTGKQLASHLLYLQNILGYGDINVVFWTLCLEIQLYLVYCILLGMFQRIGSRNGGHAFLSPATLFFICFAGSLAWPAKLLPTGVAWFWGYWHAFLAGALVCFAMGKSLRPALVFAALICLLTIGIWRSDARPVAASLTALVILACATRGKMYDWLSQAAFQWVGRISYCVYLVHVPIVLTVLGIQTRLKLQAGWTPVAYLLGTYAIIVLAAYLLHRMVERPALRWSHLLRYEPTARER